MEFSLPWGMEFTLPLRAKASKVHFHLASDMLTVNHNGQKTFDKKDVDSITSIGKSTKVDDINQIGKFGVGFKAVFSYSASPRIYSDNYCFEINELVCPYPIERKNEKSAQTSFEIPFNHTNKQQQQAFNEIAKGLTDLKDNVLLFLNNIEQISVEIDGVGTSYIIRYVHNDNLIEIRHQRLGEINYLSSYWLRFIAPISEGNKLYVAIAFRLKFKDREHANYDKNVAISEQMEIVPVQGQLSIYFPADKETTKLKFHIHAPYSSTVARDSIPYNNENKGLIEKTAILLSKSLFGIKEMGLLTATFLETLPNNKDELDDFYRLLQDKVIETMQRYPLVPTYEGDHAPACSLMQGPKDIKDVISGYELPYFTGKKQLQWAIGVMQNSRSDQFMNTLGIIEWKWDNLLLAVDERFKPHATESIKNREWLRVRDDEWMQLFYAILNTAIEERSEVKYLLPSNWSIIRTISGEHVSGVGVYFPYDENETSFEGLKIIKPEILRGDSKNRIDKVRFFLTKCGVQEAGERERVRLILEKHYDRNYSPINEDHHLQHINKFISYWMQEKDTSVFTKYHIFKSDSSKFLYQPKDLYIDDPYIETGLSALYGEDVKNKKYKLWDGYEKIMEQGIIEFSIAVGVEDKLKIQETSTIYHIEKDLLRQDIYTLIFPRYCGHTEGLGRIINLGGVKWKNVRVIGSIVRSSRKRQYD